MRRTRTGSAVTPVAAAVIALGAVACDFTGPSTREIILDLCDDAVWVGYQNDGGRWQHLGPGNASYRIRVTDRLAVARMTFNPTVEGAFTRVDWLTADQVDAVLGCRAPATTTGTISGTLTGLTNSHWATVYYGSVAVTVMNGASAWQLNARTSPAPLAAVRYDSTFPLALAGADRVILRRNHSFVPGAPVAPMDFASDEAFDPEQHAVSFTGPRTGISSAFVTAGHRIGLSYAQFLPTTLGEVARSGTIMTVPAARMAAGDIHVTSIFAEDRYVEHYAREPGDHAMSLGPPLATAVATTVAMAPYRRVRVDLPAQAEYGASVSLSVNQHRQSGYSIVELRATRDYFGGTPAVWSLTIPDFSRAAEFPVAGMPREGAFSWIATATSRRPGLTPGNANDGEVVLFASRVGPSQ